MGVYVQGSTSLWMCKVRCCQSLGVYGPASGERPAGRGRAGESELRSAGAVLCSARVTHVGEWLE